MNTKKWYHLFLLTGFMMLVSLGMSVKADAATIMDLERKFPNGAYWNHVVQSGHRYSNYNDVGSCNNPDGYTWTPCNTHKGSVGVGGYDCNSFGGGMQCNGFARKLAYDLYGSMHSSWGRGNINTLKRGDVIHYKAADTDPSYGHWVMVIGRSGTTVTLGEANRDGRCKISWGRTLNLATVTSYEIYSAPYEAAFDVADTQAPTLSNVRITDVNADGYTVVCDVSDNVGVSKIEFPSWNIDIHQGEDANWIAGSVSGNTATARIPLSALKSGVIQGNYLTDIYAWDAAGNRSSIRCPIVYIDRTAPTLSDVRIVEQDSKGYILECKASDDKEVDRVQFPTWTEVNGQDDLAADWVHNSSITGTKVGDDVYRFRVNISEHNNEYGRYVTHVYVFDKCGNNVAIPIDARIVGGLAPQKILKNGNALLTLYNEDYSWNDINALASGMRSSLAEIQDEEKGNLAKERNFFNFDFVFRDIFHDLIPFDFAAFHDSDIRFWAGVTDCESGGIRFIEKSEYDDFLKVCRASSSIPVMNTPVEIEGREYVDGGIACAVPLFEDIPCESDRLVLVLTRHKGYRKKPVPETVQRIYRRHFRNAPGLVDRLVTAPQRYNERMDKIDALEEEGKAFVIRPRKPVTVSRIEKDVEKLSALYHEGRRDAEFAYQDLLAFLG